MENQILTLIILHQKIRISQVKMTRNLLLPLVRCGIQVSTEGFNILRGGHIIEPKCFKQWIAGSWGQIPTLGKNMLILLLLLHRKIKQRLHYLFHFRHEWSRKNAVVVDNPEATPLLTRLYQLSRLPSKLLQVYHRHRILAIVAHFIQSGLQVLMAPYQTHTISLNDFYHNWKSEDAMAHGAIH